MISFEEMVAGFVTEQPDSCHVYFQLILPAGTCLPDEPEKIGKLAEYIYKIIYAFNERYDEVYSEARCLPLLFPLRSVYNI